MRTANERSGSVASRRGRVAFLTCPVGCLCLALVGVAAAQPPPPDEDAPRRMRRERPPRMEIDPLAPEAIEPPMMPRRGGDGPPFRRPMSDEERTEMLDFIREQFPLIAEELDAAQADYPQRYERRLARLMPEMRRLKEMMETDPERAELLIQERRLDMRARMTAQRYAAATDANRERIRRELRGQLDQLFNVRIQRREADIRSLEVRIANLKAKLDESKAQRSEQIEKQLEDYLSFEEPRAFKAESGADEPPMPRERPARRRTKPE